MSERVKRPNLERTRPIRSWSALLAPPAASGLSAQDGERPGQPADVIARSVELGYRVVDEYISQGRKAAERLGARSSVPGALTGDVQELGARMMRYASDFVAVWMQLMESAMRGGIARPAPSPPPAAPAAHAIRAAAADGAPSKTSAPGTRIRIEVSSLWPTEVSVDLRPEATRAPLVVHALRSLDPHVPRLDDIALASGPGNDPPLFRIRIPPSQPPGIYNGLIVDLETSRPVGTVSVRLWRE